MKHYFNKILIANRSEIAVRVIKACKSLGIATVVVYSEVDKNSCHVQMADEAVCIGGASPLASYLNIDKIIDAARKTKAEAIHPGYGFLAENSLFAERCEKEGIVFIGPSSEAIRLLGNKVESRIKMGEAGLRLIPGMTGSGESLEEFEEVADHVGYPVLIKAAAGGGGKGMRVVEKKSELMVAVEAAKREAENAFGDGTLYLEKYLVSPRHVEIQIMADSYGNFVHLFERECSIQRRHQKIIEETPSLALDDKLRGKMGDDAVKVARTANYPNAGTVEFLLDENKNYYFLEMNTRIQVEHPVTEMVTSTDLVAEQIKIAAGEKLSPEIVNAKQSGHAIECRIYAEDGENNFMPSTGRIVYYHEPQGEGIRVDSGINLNSEISVNYDPIMSKLIVHGKDRQAAIKKMIGALESYKILGVKNCKSLMIEILRHPQFSKGQTFTNFIEKNINSSKANDVLTVEMAATLAAVFVQSQKDALLSSKNKKTSPWQTIGSWEIGKYISE